MRTLILLALLALAPIAPAAAQQPAAGPSYDCAKATTPDEQAVCASPLLSELDRLVTAAYRDFTPEFADKRDIAHGVIADRNACASDEACIAAVYADALAIYAGSAAPHWPADYAAALMLRKAETQPAPQSAALPQKVGECLGTTIAKLTDRFGNPLTDADPSQGSAVAFANGGYQASYDREPGLALSEIGDQVTLCLMQRPRDCPPGDDRSHNYLALDTDKHLTWQLFDATHLCGGA